MPNNKPCHISKAVKVRFFKELLLTSLFISLGLSGFAQAPSISYQTPQTYTANTAITPLAPTNTGGAVPATIYGQVTTFAGSGAKGLVNGTGTAASFNSPTRLGQDASGNLFVADRDNNAIRKITPTGAVSIFATGFNQPNGATVDVSGNVYVADAANNSIKVITPTGVVSTFAGNGSAGSTNGIGMLASFFYPYSVAADASGNIYVGDSQNNLVRKITPSAVVSSLAGSGYGGFANGTGTAAAFNDPAGVNTDAAGNVYVADAYNNRVRKITPAGVVTTYAGNGTAGTTNGPASSATFTTPAGIAADMAGNIYVADIGDNLIRKIDATGNVTTLAGSGAAGAVNGTGTSASFNHPNDVQSNPGGFLYVTDYGNNLIRKVIVTGYTIDKTLPPGLTFDPTTGIISGTPTAASPATNYTVTAYNATGSSSTVVNIQVILATALKPSIITFPPIPPNSADANNNLTPAATSTNTETPITYTSSDTTVAVVTASGLIHLVGPGVTTITASQNGDANYTPATPVSQLLTVYENQAINFPVIASETACSADFSANATSYSSAYPITYSSSNPAVATVSAGGIIHIVGVGTTVITANQAGGGYYIAAAPQSQTLTVTSGVVPIVTITPDHAAVCVGSPVTFTATVSNAAGGLTYQWTLNGVNVGANSPTYTDAAPLPADVFQCRVTNTASCNAVGSSNSYTGIAVNAYVTPAVVITSSVGFPVCSGTAITFTATPTNGGASPGYQWQVNGVNAGSNSPAFTSATFANGDEVTCILTNTAGACLTAATATSNAIKVAINAIPNPAPSVAITVSANNVYAGTPVTFTATPANAGTVTSYQWTLNGTNVGTNSNTYSSSSLVNNDVIACTIISNIPCTVPATSPALIENILPPLAIKIPNTFTPNGDGINDKWNIPDLISYPDCFMSIFNRWGSLVYQSKGYSNAWDGNYNGQPLPFSTYYYIIDLGNNSPKLSGYVTIVR